MYIGSLNHNKRRSSGMTLIEIMIALLILTIIGIGISAALLNSWNSERTISDQNEAQKRSQYAVDRIVDDLRGATEITTAGPTSVTAAFKKIENPTAVLQRTVNYQLQGSDLICTRYDALSGVTTTETVCREITNLEFTPSRVHYYGGQPVVEAINGSETLQDVESLRIDLTVGITWNTGASPGAQYNCSATQTSWVKFRNKV